MKILKCFILFLLLTNIASAQLYKKNLGYGGYAWNNYEAYDKGLYILKPFDSIPKLLKLDVNGNILWQRDIKSYKYYLVPTAIYPASDGGVMVSGYSTMVVNSGNFFLLKLDACGEKEWCTDYDKGDYASDFMVSDVFQIGNKYITGSQATLKSTNYGSYFTFDSLGNIINQFHIKDHEAAYRYIRKVNNQYCFSYSDIDTYIYPNDSNSSSEYSCNIGISKDGNLGWINLVGADSGIIACESANAVDYKNGFGYGAGEIMGNGALTKLNDKGDIVWLKYMGYLKSYIYTNDIPALNYTSDTSLLIALVATQVLNSNAEYSTTLYLSDTAANIKDSLMFGDTGTMEKYRCMDILNTSDGNFLLIFQYKKGPGDSDFVYLQKINSKLQTVNFDTTKRVYDWKCGHAVKPYDSLNIDDAKKVKIIYDSTKFIKYVHYPTSINNIIPIKYTVNLYPNPATDIINIDLSNFTTEKNMMIELIDMTGKTIIQQKIPNGTKLSTLDIQNIAAGTYNVVILSGSDRLSWSMVVKQ